MTNADIAAGEAALRDYAVGQSWKARLVPEQDFRDGAIGAIRAADASPDQSPVARQQAAEAAWRASLVALGHSGDVTPQQSHDGAAVVLAAVNKVRSQA